MSQPSLDSVNRYCRDLAGRSAELSDRELLNRFATNRDGTAFALLLDRHGPLVRGVCRRILRDDHRADDVFQAVFMVLAEKAGSLQRGDLLANWLFGVARRLAHRAQRQQTRLEQRERKAAEARPEAILLPVWDDLLAVLEEELQRLPAKFRAPLLACYHQGRTQDEAAKDCGWNVRTLRRRLAKGREMLRQRMERRGATLTAGLFAAALAPSASEAGLPAALRDGTLAAVLGGPATEPVRALVRGGLHMLALSKLKIWAGIGLIVVTILTAGGFAWRGGSPGLEAKPADPPPVAAQPPRADDTLPEGAMARLGTLRLRHGGFAMYHHTLAFGPDDKTLLSGGDQFLRQWRVGDGIETNAFRLDAKSRVLSTLVAADGKTAFQVVDKEKAIRVQVFDTITWKETREIELTPQPGRTDRTPECVVSPDSSLLGIITSAGTLALWDLATGRHVRTIANHNRIFSVAFATDGAYAFMMTEGGIITKYDVRTGQLVTAMGTGITSYHGIPMTVRSDGKAAATVGLDRPDGPAKTPAPDNPAIRFITMQDQPKLDTLPLFALRGRNDLPISKLAFAPDGKSIFIAIQGTAPEWWRLPLDGKEPLRVPTGERSRITELAVSHDGKTLATCNIEGVIRLWDAGTGKERPSPDGHRGPVAAVAFQQDGSVVTASPDASVRFWDRASGKQKAIMAAGDGTFFSRMSLSPNGRWLIQSQSDFGLAGAQILETDTGEVRYRLNIPPNREYLFTGGGKSFITQEQDGTPKEWDLSNGKKLRVGVPGAGGPHRLSPDGEILVSVDNSACVGVNMSAGKEVFRWGLLQKNVFQETLGQANNEYVTDAAISPDGTTIALGVNCGQPAAGRIVLCELTKGKILHEIDLGTESPGILAFAPNGKHLVAASNQTRIYDVATGKLTRTLDGHRGTILAVTFDPEGKRLATASADSTVLIWDMSK